MQMNEPLRPAPKTETPPPRPPRRAELRQAGDRRARLQTIFLGIIAFALLLFLLVEARFVLIALVVSIILFSLTAEAISAIGRIRLGPARIPNWLASLVALLLIASGLLWLSVMVVSQVNVVLATALTYAEQAQTAAAELSKWAGERAASAVQQAVSGINLPAYLRGAASQASNVVQMSVLIILFVGFMFAERIWYPVKLRSLMGSDTDTTRAQVVVRSIMHRVNRYLIVKAGVSAVTGAAIWLIFWLMGLDLALPVATLTFILNFIPSIGSIIATFLAALVAFVQTGVIGDTLIVTSAAAVTQFAIGNVLDPMLLGRTLRLSSFGIIISLAFWGAVWGVPGMFLAVPIMVALMILCAQTEWLRPVAVLLSREGLPDDGVDEDAAAAL